MLPGDAGELPSNNNNNNDDDDDDNKPFAADTLSEHHAHTTSV